MAESTLSLTPLERYVLVSFVRRMDEGKPRKGKRKDVRKIANVLRSLGGDAWDRDCWQIAQDARAAALERAEAAHAANAQQLAKVEAEAAHVNFLNGLSDNADAASPYTMPSSALEYLRDELDEQDREGEFALANALLWARLMDKLDAAAVQAEAPSNGAKALTEATT